MSSLQDLRALAVVHPLDRVGRAGHPVQGLAAGDVVGPDDEVPDGGDPLHLLVGDEGIRDRLVPLPAARAVEVPGVAALETSLHAPSESASYALLRSASCVSPPVSGDLIEKSIVALDGTSS